VFLIEWEVRQSDKGCSELNMKFIFANHDRSAQIRRIREAIDRYRESGRSDLARFQMHPVYDDILGQLGDQFLGYWKDQVALVGLGGYGRKEMSPYSDIDILFLKSDDAPEGVYRGVRSVLYLLWDARVEFGHSVRTVSECCNEAGQDLAVLTSMLDLRLVWGSCELLKELLIQIKRLVNDADPFELYFRIESEILKSSDKFGQTIYLLEPHLKEGPGSLRYIQLITWLGHLIFGCPTLEDLSAAGICKPQEVEQVRRDVAFLSKLRNGLHFYSGRRDDRLKFDAQAVLAGTMGFADAAERRAVEAFMGEYYRRASNLDYFGRMIRAKVRLFLRPAVSPDVKRLRLDERFYVGAGGINHYYHYRFASDPKELVLAFRRVADTGCDLDIRVVDLIKSKLSIIDEGFIKDPLINQAFLDIFRTQGSVARAVNSMMKIGFLEHFIPEFAWIRFLPQHDVYHQYTVDLHTVAVLEHIDRFARQRLDPDDQLLGTIFAKLDQTESLYLAALLHDIAKGRGPGHEVKGETIALPILERLGVSSSCADEVRFLIRNHLAMTHLAFKKDLHDAALIQRFAENVMHKRRLDLLFLLTHADLRGVGPTAFNSWRRMLLEELYFRTLDVIQGEGVEGEDLGEWVDEIRATVRQLTPVQHHGPLLEAFLNQAGSRYFLDFYPGVIAEHFTDLQSFLASHNKTSLGPDDVIARKVDHYRPGYSSITVITRDRKGLFFRIAGTLAANRINILGAWTHSIGDITVGTYHVNAIPEGPLDDPDRWKHFLADLKEVLGDRLDVDDLVRQSRQKAGPFLGTSKPRFPVRIEIDNAASDRATIIEVYAHDRPGLLYDITRKLSALDLNIVLTKITTEIDQAADIFYVHGPTGSKIVDFDQLDFIQKELRSHLASMEEAYFGSQG
jgi:[protein-PII] uridylyltransferase